jgi:hypothetical protein
VPQPSYALAGDAPARPSFPTLSDADLAAGALSELRGLYEPSFTSQPAPVPVGGLTRRTRRAETEIEPVEDTPAVPRRTRNPAEVRGMLSGFRAGVERGRTAPYDLGDGTDAPDSTS